MYMAGRLRTASSPSSTLMSLAVYVSALMPPSTSPSRTRQCAPRASGRASGEGQEDLLGLLDLVQNADTGVAVQLGKSIIQE